MTKHPLSVLGVFSSFLVLANYYNRFISNFANIPAPISYLLSGKCEFVWGDEQQVAFDALKFKLMSARVLALLEFG